MQEAQGHGERRRCDQCLVNTLWVLRNASNDPIRQRRRLTHWHYRLCLLHLPDHHPWELRWEIPAPHGTEGEDVEPDYVAQPLRKPRCVRISLAHGLRGVCISDTTSIRPLLARARHYYRRQPLLPAKTSRLGKMSIPLIPATEYDVWGCLYPNIFRGTAHRLRTANVSERPI